MKIETKKFGEINGETVTKYTLINQHETKISLITLGATWQDFSVKETDGRHQLLVNFDNLEDYIKTPYYLCKAVGRVAGRIAGAQFSIAGKDYHIENNEKDYALHGGSHGFSFINWSAESRVDEKQASVIFKHYIKSSDDQYPGNLEATIIYTLTEKDRVTVTFLGKSDQTTLFNPTLHAYFNVTDSQHDLRKQWLKINSSKRLELNTNKIPTGNFLPVKGSNYDFQQKENLQDVLDKLKKDQSIIELDDIFLVTPNSQEPVAEIGDSADKRRIKIYSQRNAVVVFTTNPLDPEREKQHDFNALAIECQTLPDAIHHQNFGDIILPAGKTAVYNIAYQYEH